MTTTLTRPADDTVRFKRSRFLARFPKDYLFSPSHFWLFEHSPGRFRIGMTDFATRMLGEIVEFDFEVAKGDAVKPGDVVGWMEGFKAVADIYCVAEGTFLGTQPEILRQRRAAVLRQLWRRLALRGGRKARPAGRLRRGIHRAFERNHRHHGRKTLAIGGDRTTMTENGSQQARYIMIGGFLGAGKSTSVGRLARHLSDQGLQVGLITNDQGAGLVDTRNLRSQGFDVEEIAGGCFCCRFDSLRSAAEKLSGADASRRLPRRAGG